MGGPTRTEASALAIILPSGSTIPSLPPYPTALHWAGWNWNLPPVIKLQKARYQRAFVGPVSRHGKNQIPTIGVPDNYTGPRAISGPGGIGYLRSLQTVEHPIARTVNLCGHEWISLRQYLRTVRRPEQIIAQPLSMGTVYVKYLPRARPITIDSEEGKTPILSPMLERYGGAVGRPDRRAVSFCHSLEIGSVSLNRVDEYTWLRSAKRRCLVPYREGQCASVG